MRRRLGGRGALGLALWALLLLLAFRADRWTYLRVAGFVAEETGDRPWRFGRPEGGSAPVLEAPLGLLRRMGEIWFVAFVAATMLVLAPGRRGQVVALFLAVAVTVAAGQACLKHAIGKLRPAAELSARDVDRLVAKGGEMTLWRGRTYNRGSALFRPPFASPHAGLSLPSGHSALAFACFAVLGRALPRGRRWFLGLACGVAASRVLAGEHFLSDVVAGAGVGYACARAVLAVPRVRRLMAGAA